MNDPTLLKLLVVDDLSTMRHIVKPIVKPFSKAALQDTPMAPAATLSRRFDEVPR